MKMQGYIRPTAETDDLWWQLWNAKERGDRQTVGRMSDEIRKAHRFGRRESVESVDVGVKV